MPDKEDQDSMLLRQTHDKVTKVYTALIGINGQGGLIKKVDAMYAEVTNNRKKIWQTRLILFVVIAALLITGALDARILQLFAG